MMSNAIILQHVVDLREASQKQASLLPLTILLHWHIGGGVLVGGEGSPQPYWHIAIRSYGAGEIIATLYVLGYDHGVG